jgi:hypothetical protein
MQKKAWSKALRAAEGAAPGPAEYHLREPPRAGAGQAGAAEGAGEVVATALARDPENAYTYANTGLDAPGGRPRPTRPSRTSGRRCD